MYFLFRLYAAAGKEQKVQRMGYGPDARGILLPFPERVHPASYPIGSGRSFPRAVKRPWRGAQNSFPPSLLSTEVKNWWNYSLRTVCCMCLWRAHGQVCLLHSISSMYARTINAHIATLQSGIIVPLIR